jgi:hypothetical protein
LLFLEEFSARFSQSEPLFRHIAFHPSTNTLAGGEMSLSSEHRRLDNNARSTEHPDLRDLPESPEDHKLTKESTVGPREDPLVEHILDFLDKYPARFAPRGPLVGCMRAS